MGGAALLASLVVPPIRCQVPLGMERQQEGRFTVAAAPGDAGLASALLHAAMARDTFPWLPRPRARVLILVAPDRARFRELTGPEAPEYGVAIAFPAQQRIVMQGRSAASDAGDPVQVLRHELAHLALHEQLGNLPARWFDEGYATVAAGEWGRDEVFATNIALVLRGMPSLDALDARFGGGAEQATAAYALAYRAVMELASLDPRRGLTLFFDYWRRSGEFEIAVREAFGLTQSAFEKQWRDRTLHRYGALALFADISLAALMLLFVVTPLYLARRRRDRERLQSMLRSEAEAERRERESAIAELLRSVAPPDTGDGSATSGR